jgi:signal transduction histidine kinase/CheY-like chemotaxis protein
VLPAAVRRRWPRAVLALVVTGEAVLTALSTSVGPPLAVAFVMYLILLRLPRREALRLLAGTLLVTAAGFVVFGIVPHGIFRTGGAAKAAGLVLEGGLLITAAWMIGDTVRQQRAYLAGRQEQAERRAQEQLAQALRASTEERLQIARELHDVVAHSMSLIAVQAGVANYVIAAQPEEAARALSSIEQISRGALREMRALLGVLRADPAGAASDRNEGAPGPEGAGLVPAPGLADLDGLVARTAEAGVRVDLDVRGERPPLPAGLDLAAYRVIQEAITNVIKHAATDRCRVAVTYQEDALTLEITDHGLGPRGNRRGRPRQPGGRPRARRDAGARRHVRRGIPGRATARGRVPGHRLVPAGGQRPMTIRVLVADDQALVRGSFRILVDTAPDLTSVGEAATGAEAVQLARREKPDIVLMDIRMPRMDGIEATGQITATPETSAVRVLILTTFDLDEYVFAALRAGASGFLLKDTPPADLLAAIRVVAAGRRGP